MDLFCSFYRRISELWNEEWDDEKFRERFG